MTTVDISNESPPEQVISAPLITLNLPNSPKLYFRHGWQSWSLAAWTDPEIPFPVQKPKLLHAMQHDPNYAYHLLPHGSWFGAVEMQTDGILLLGSLSLDAHVELNKNQLRGWYESGTGEWFIGYGTEKSIFFRYAELLGQRLGYAKHRTAPRAWCSWYSLYTTIDELVLYKVVNDLGDLPFDVLIVDDGWQVAIGDWQANNKFPSGMTALVDKIKLSGRRAGLWLAPLIAVKSSKLFRDHSTWFLKDQNGKFVSAGFNWGEQLYTIDTTHPEALVWLAELMEQVHQWGFEYIKLDFLYGGALPGKRYVDMPREAAYRNGLKVLREAMGENTFFLACGAPIVPSLGLCDALRIGPDVAGEWENVRDAVLLYNPTTPGTKNAIRTTIHRLWLSPLVQTDPDVVYFRSIDCSLNSQQKSMLQDLALICNFKATSDLPQWLTENDRKAINNFLAKQPKVQQTGRYTFRLEGRNVEFSEAIDLPAQPVGLNKITSIIVGWLSNLKLLQFADEARKRGSLKKRIKRSL
jgi:alpha-galactosidase